MTTSMIAELLCTLNVTDNASSIIILYRLYETSTTAALSLRNYVGLWCRYASTFKHLYVVSVCVTDTIVWYIAGCLTETLSTNLNKVNFPSNIEKCLAAVFEINVQKDFFFNVSSYMQTSLYRHVFLRCWCGKMSDSFLLSFVF